MGRGSLPAGEGRPDEVVVGKPVVEDGDERLPLRVALVHRRPGAASLLHLRQRRSTPAATPPLLSLTRHARSMLLRERAGVSSVDALESLRCEQRAEQSRGSNVRIGAGIVWAGPSTVRAGT